MLAHQSSIVFFKKKRKVYRGQHCEPTRLHSSRMHTARSLTVFSSMLGGGCLVWGVPGPRRSGPGGAWSQGAGPGGAWLGGGVIHACTEAEPPL